MLLFLAAGNGVCVSVCIYAAAAAAAVNLTSQRENGAQGFC